MPLKDVIGLKKQNSYIKFRKANKNIFNLWKKLSHQWLHCCRSSTYNLFVDQI